MTESVKVWWEIGRSEDLDSQSGFRGTVVSLVLSSAGRFSSSSVALQLMFRPESWFRGVNLYSDWTELETGFPTLLGRTTSPLIQVKVSSSAG